MIFDVVDIQSSNALTSLYNLLEADVIIQKFLEFKPRRGNLVGSYAIVPTDLDDEIKVNKNYLSRACHQLSQMIAEVR